MLESRAQLSDGTTRCRLPTHRHSTSHLALPDRTPARRQGKPQGDRVEHRRRQARGSEVRQRGERAAGPVVPISHRGWLRQQVRDTRRAAGSGLPRSPRSRREIVTSRTEQVEAANSSQGGRSRTRERLTNRGKVARWRRGLASETRTGRRQWTAQRRATSWPHQSNLGQGQPTRPAKHRRPFSRAEAPRPVRTRGPRSAR